MRGWGLSSCKEKSQNLGFGFIVIVIDVYRLGVCNSHQKTMGGGGGATQQKTLEGRFPSPTFFRIKNNPENLLKNLRFPQNLNNNFLFPNQQMLG